MEHPALPPPPPPVVLLFLKAPRPGFAKTRLAAALGNEGAAELAAWLGLRQLQAIPPAWTVEVHFAPAEAEAEVRQWLGPRPHLFPQVEGDLGQRLTAAVAGAFGRGAQQLLLLGGDCPDLTAPRLLEAAALLTQSPLVLGPAADGGYYLLGLRPDFALATWPLLFSQIPWSTARTFLATMRAATVAGWPYRILRPLPDLDTPTDLARFPTIAARFRPEMVVG